MNLKLDVSQSQDSTRLDVVMGWTTASCRLPPVKSESRNRTSDLLDDG